jgi:hypothetical protein
VISKAASDTMVEAGRTNKRNTNKSRLGAGRTGAGSRSRAGAAAGLTKTKRKRVTARLNVASLADWRLLRAGLANRKTRKKMTHAGWLADCQLLVQYRTWLVRETPCLTRDV